MGPLPARCRPPLSTMIVLHPNSVCDVCLEGYGGPNVPHAIACGHTFCLRCLRSLTRQNCPLCRTPFQYDDVRKLHIDKCSRPSTPLHHSSAPGSPDSGYNEFPTPARDFHTRITRIVLDGAKATEVRDFLDEVRKWLSTQPSDEHADLRAAYLLLFKYTDLQYKVKEEKATILELRAESEELNEKIRSGEEKYQELAQKRVNEMEKAMSIERNLRDSYDRMDKEWREKYDGRVAECKRLADELKELNAELSHLKAIRNPLPTPPRVVESHHYFTERSVDEPMSIVNEDAQPLDEEHEDDHFQLSPIPTTATLPVSNLPNRQNFRPLTAEDSDIEDLKSKRPNAYMRRTIDPIQIRPPMPRMSSTSSMRDVHMASCSSSPNTSFQYTPREKERTEDFAMTSPPARRPSLRRPSVSSAAQLREQDEAERARTQQQQLRELLELQHLPSLDAFDPPKPRSPDGTASISRHPSPDAPSAASAARAAAPRPGLSRASTAAMQAERERARSLSHKEPPAPSPMQTSPARERVEHREAYAPAHTPLAQSSMYHARRPSVSGSIRGRSSTSPTAAGPQPSGLSRQFWAMQQEPQRTPA